MDTPNTIPIEILHSILLPLRAAAENQALSATPSQQHSVQGYIHTYVIYLTINEHCEMYINVSYLFIVIHVLETNIVKEPTFHPP
jgi:hypothetical protein